MTFSKRDINELSKANLTRKYSLTNAILQFSLSQTILSHTKDKEITRKW